MGVVLQIVCLVLALLGLISLSAFLLTVVLSDKVMRHPVFVNLICTWVIWSVFMVFRYVRAIAMPGDAVPMLYDCHANCHVPAPGWCSPWFQVASVW
jgi:hypothetical protein